MTITRTYRVSTENRWKSVLLGHLNRLDQNRSLVFPIEHEQSLDGPRANERDQLQCSWVIAASFPLAAVKYPGKEVLFSNLMRMPKADTKPVLQSNDRRHLKKGIQ